MSGFVRRLSAIPWRHIAGEALSRAFLVAQAFCAVHFVDHHVCSLAFVRGPSMLPAMNLAGDVVAVDRVSVQLGRVSRGDVVLLISPEDPRKAVAKRVLGMEGDAVTYLVDPGSCDASKTVVVPQGHVWVQGDNIYDSRDSRQFGAVPYGLITGKIFCRVWPLEGFGSIDSQE
ncbi:mitochondrial ATP-independent inner membrane protease subunit 1a-like [Phragmites australis]|uniref:mitochondrial ATP-independent inner membrane protease subunit 1a-like n=1 Tax=Phragmites australis TaxID=29695 RepID=UPI002D766BF6|nr:mitochondrial ATP-independent inner membrane protease subunit 1a-like [Phragmites australis]XP_062197096.1 mitochondrial ATP-independent inner membrane protease subunit 1a-like [Phragmites australis]